MITLKRTSIFRLLAAFSACAAAYHVAGVLGVLPDDATPAWRHALFVGIDAIGAWYLLTRPLVLLPVFMVLVVQQFVSHGSRVVLWGTRDGRIDTLSVITLAALVLALLLLILDVRDRSPRVRRIVCPFGPPPDGFGNA